MDKYQKLVRELIEEEIKERQQWDSSKSRADIMQEFRDNGFDNLFGNIDGSRTYSTYEAQKFIDESGAIWDDEILDLFAGLGDDYFTETLKRGAETLDVVICELVADGVLWELAETEGIELQ